MNPAKYIPNLAIRTRLSLAATGAWTLRRMSGKRAIVRAFSRGAYGVILSRRHGERAKSVMVSGRH
jgi:hypothetical protein